jgi:hypothetical protein
MAMFRRSRKPAPPLRRRQQEIARQEAELREKLETLQRIVTQTPPAQSKSSAEIPERVPASAPIQKRFHVSIASDVPQAFDIGRRPGRPCMLRKERRQGRIVFLMLLAALAIAVMWLISQMYP